MTVVQQIRGVLEKYVGPFKAAKAAKLRGEIAQQIVFAASAAIHAAVFYLMDVTLALPGEVGVELPKIEFAHETSSDIWVKKIKVAIDVFNKETEVEIGLGKLGDKVDPSIIIKVCSFGICGGKVSLNYPIVSIPDVEDDPDKLNGALLAIEAKAQAGVERDKAKAVSGDVSVVIEAKAFATLKYDIKLFSALAIANCFNGK